MEIELSAYEDQTFAGEVDSIDTSSSSGSSTVSYNVTAAFAGDITGIYTDMTGNVTFISRQVTDVLYVSNKAVQFDGTTSYVKVKDADGTIRWWMWRRAFPTGSTWKSRPVSRKVKLC